MGPKTEKMARILLLVKSCVRFKKREDLMNEDFSSVWIEVSDKHKKLIVGAYYREWKTETGSRSVPEQHDRLQIFLDQLTRARQGNAHVITLGDMNLDKNKYEDEGYGLKALVNTLQSALASTGMTDLDLGNTFCASRLNSQGLPIQSALDHLYSSHPEKLLSFEAKKNSMSDHLPIEAVVSFKKIKEKSFTKVARNFRKFKQEDFNLDLANQPWEQLAGEVDAESSAQLFTSFVTRCLDKHAPFETKTIRTSGPRNKGLNKELRTEMSKRDHLKKLLTNPCESSNKEANMQKYRSARNRVTRMVRNDKKKKVSDEIARDSSMRNIWRVTNNITQPSRNQKPFSLKEGNQQISDERQIADIMNKFFIDKIAGLREKIPKKGSEDPLIKVKQKVQGRNLAFSLKPVSEDQVRAIIKNMEKKPSHGSDHISSELLKASVEVLIIPLTRIINLSITSGIFPEVWKTAVVKPILKKGDAEDKANYRPVSLLSVPSMVLERVINDQMQNFFEKNKLLGKNQMGFRKHRSTTAALVALMSKWLMAADRGDATGCVLFDLSAAFDCLDKDILCRKLVAYGFDKKSVQWVNSYLTNRKQCVQIGDKLSEVVELPFGSPQGSCLSPLLFLVLIADIDQWTDLAELFGFADDTSALFSAPTVGELEEKINRGVEQILGFMSSNLLVVNPLKTGYLANFEGKMKESTITVGEDRINSSDSEKLLGLTLSANLSWRGHVQELKKALHQRLFIIRRLRESLPKKQLIIVAEAIFNSKIRYGLPLFAHCRVDDQDPTNGQMASIQKLQNDMMRTILGVTRSDHVSVNDLLERTGFTSVNRMAVQSVLAETFKILHHDTIPDLKTILTAGANTDYNLRSQHKNNLNDVPLKRSRNKGFLQTSATTWNSLVAEQVGDNTNIKKFKTLTRDVTKNVPP